MAKTTVNVNGIELPYAAARNCEETGHDPQDDVAALRAGVKSGGQLFAECLVGAEPDRVQGWREYAEAIEAAADAAGPLAAQPDSAP